MFTYDASDIIAFSAVIVSLVAVIISPIVSFLVAKRQIISPIRQKWIDELRELISEYLSECERLIILGEDGFLNNEETNGILFRRLLYLEQKLKLMLNPNEEKHIQLLDAIRSIADEIHHGVGNIIDFGTKLRAATGIAQVILKVEWRRVKSGEI